jgi:hypothetical protein
MITYLMHTIDPVSLAAEQSDDAYRQMAQQAIRLPGTLAENAHRIGDGIAIEVSEDLVAEVDSCLIGILLRGAWQERVFVRPSSVPPDDYWPPITPEVRERMLRVRSGVDGPGEPVLDVLHRLLAGGPIVKG